jgi:hypothetical protein
MAEEEEEGDKIAPPSGGHIHSYLSRFSYTDIIVLLVNECLGVPLCIAGGENFSHTDWVGSAIGWGFGIPLCVSGVTFPFWRDPVKIAVAGWAAKRWQLLVPTAVLLAFAYATGPEMYRRATFPAAVQADLSSENISKATAAVQSKLDAANRQLQEEREKAKPLIPPGGVISGLQATKELNDLRAQLGELKRQNDALRQTTPTPSLYVESDGSPIKWEPSLWFTGGSEGIRYIRINGANSSGSIVQMKAASFMSELTGESRNLYVSSQYGNLGSEMIPIQDTNPTPRGAKIQLVLEWKPTISVQEFMSRWGKTLLSIDYDDFKYRKVLDETFMRDALVRDIVGADVILGIPRVTKKEPVK